MEKSEEINLKKLADFLGIRFHDLKILKNALIHRSYLNENQSNFENNERLEFLGDAVLELVITEYLFKKYPERPEGELTSFRAATVRTESLAETSLSLGLGDFLYISKGEEQTGGRTKPYILANTFEALLGAIYLDQGFSVVKNFIYKNLTAKIPKIIELRLDIDAKSKFQEISQEVLAITPNYELVEQKGPDHDKIFTMKVMVSNLEFGRGNGKSKQEAEEKAALFALKNWDCLLKENESLLKK